MGIKHFEKLTPIANVDLKGYEEALEFVFNNKDIKNIAISGPYSAGKSSVIETYKTKSKKRFLHISLAHFEGNKGKENPEINDNNTVNESMIEGKIINQLIHQIDQSKIAKTAFKVKSDPSIKSIILKTIYTMILLLNSTYLIYFVKWTDFISPIIFKNSYDIFKSISGGDIVFIMPAMGSVLSKALNFTITPFAFAIACLIELIIIGIVVYTIIKIQETRNIFKKLNFKGNEIEIFEKCDESYFDKYLNEVLYLFDNSGADAVVFEDIDRFNRNEIFKRLREINTLINNKRMKMAKEPLRFLYLIKDDIFTSKDRTKFFEFIIPIIPVVDSSNAYDQFISHFKTAGIFEKFNQEFLQGISLYVDDMRLLKNIYNEFIIYYERIGTTEQDLNKLLAIIVYKNIFPKDFSDTQINIGFISTLFNNKEEIIREAINEIDTEINKINETIELCKKEYLHNIEELNETFTQRNYNGYTYLDSKNIKYIERKERIEIIQNNQLDLLPNEINKLENEKIIIKNKSISKLITRDNIDKIFNVKYKDFLGECNEFKEIKSSQYFDLIKYLIRNRYIDESYGDYMTYFYPNSLTKNDKVFLRSITDMKAKPWDYKIDNVQLVLSNLNESNFREVEVLNYYIFTYIQANEKNNTKYLDALFEQLQTDKNYNFIIGYFKSINKFDVFIKIICKYWSSFIEEVMLSSKLDIESQVKLIVELFYNAADHEIDAINKDNFLESYISSNVEFVQINNPDIDKLIKQFVRLDVKFKNLIFDQFNTKLIDEIYKSNLYELSWNNINLILSKKYCISNENNELEERNYSIIQENNITCLNEYIEENIEEYMNELLSNCSYIIRDSIQYALMILNNTNIKIELKSRYIEHLTTVLPELKEVTDIKLWELLLGKRLVKYNENNILEYYFNSGKGLDEHLISFINSSSVKLTLSKEYIDSTFEEEATNSLFKSIQEEDSLNNERYEHIIKQLGYVSIIFNLTEMSDDKMNILIKNGIIKMTIKNIDLIRENYPNHIKCFIERNIAEYLNEIVEEKPLTNEELIYLLRSDIKNEFKIELLSHNSEPISIINENFADIIKKYIIENNFYEEDLPNLINTYNEYSDKLKQGINKLSIDNVQYIIDMRLQLTKELLEVLLEYEAIDKSDKVNLIMNNFKDLSKGECEEYFRKIEATEYVKLLNNGRPKLEISDINKRVLQALKEKCWIEDYYIEGEVFKYKRKREQKKLVLN